MRMPARFASVEERHAFGKSLRRALPRGDQGRWTTWAGRRDPLATLLEASHGRLPELLPIKWGRMAASPFGFFRGAVPVMALDLARSPVTGVYVQMCGDAHVRNLGAFAAPDGHLVFDINDFDETMPGPWEWDVNRLAASLVLAGREAGNGDRLCTDAVGELVSSYRGGLKKFAAMSALDLARFEIRRYRRGPVTRILERAERATPLHSLEKLTVASRGGLRRFPNRPPLLRPLEPDRAKRVIGSLKAYRDTVSDDRQLVLDAYRLVDVAFKVVGTGSVGTRDYAVLAFGDGADHPLFLQVKEEVPSGYAAVLPRVARPSHEGQRVAQGQHRMQTVSDPFLGWTTCAGRHYLVRQLADHKAAIEPDEMKGLALKEYARVCGEVLAKAHTRTGDAAILHGYCGDTNRLDRAVGRFAIAYADQTESDHAAFLKAIRAGWIRARRGI
ncbi:MAG TPA: DUF2252 domain-containing protein [Candidatus Methylomirabilis sp.]|nr:DUF2252 domain-containing protein [Candidatus Methylomirabilis sp.]